MLKQIQYNLAKLLRFPINPEMDMRVQNMILEIKRRGKLRFTIQKNEEGWIAECEEIKGIITGGTNPHPTQEEVESQIKDAVFTAFGIPPYLCKDALLRNVEESVKELVYVGK
jgi:predicted RNase H-like HicB family nuclease